MAGPLKKSGEKIEEEWRKYENRQVKENVAWVATIYQYFVLASMVREPTELKINSEFADSIE